MYTEFMNPYSRNMLRRLNQILSTPSMFGAPMLEHEYPFGSLSSGELMTNVREDDDAFYVEMEVPGVKPDDIDLSFIGNELTLKISRPVPKDEVNKRYLRQEWVFHQFEPVDFCRTFRIGESVDAAKISAHHADGVLTVHLPKTEKLKPRKIEVTRK